MKSRIKVCVCLVLAATLMSAVGCAEKRTYEQCMADGKAAYEAARGDEDFRRAAAYFDAAVEKKPKSAKAWYWRGRSHAAFMDCASAQSYFTQALRLDPGMADAWYRRALCGVLMQKKRAAIIADLEKALELDPHHQGAKRQLWVLGKISASPQP